MIIGNALAVCGVLLLRFLQQVNATLIRYICVFWIGLYDKAVYSTRQNGEHQIVVRFHFKRFTGKSRDWFPSPVNQVSGMLNADYPLGWLTGSATSDLTWFLILPTGLKVFISYSVTFSSILI